MGLSLAKRRFDRILLVKPSSLGDLIHALPVLHGLRTRYPSARISWLVADAFAPLVADHPELDEVIPFDRRRYGRFGRSLRSSVEFVQFLRMLGKREFDLAIDLQGLFRSGLLTQASGAPVRIGFSRPTARELASLFYTDCIRVRDPDLHAAERNYLVGRMLGFADVPMVFDLAVTSNERAAARRILATAGIGEDERFLAVLPGARWETKRWPPDRFADAIDQILEQYGVRSVLLGGAGENHLGDRIISRASKGPINLIGRTGLREMVAVLERSSVVLAHDSAPMHIGAALGRPLVSILGPTSRRRTGPYGEGRHTVLQADLPCVPCYLKRLSQCPHDHRCMADVAVEAVVMAVGAGLADRINVSADSPGRVLAGPGSQ